MSAGSPDVVYIGGLTPDVSEDAIKAFASKAGSVVSVTPAESKKFAYVQYSSEAVAASAVSQLNGQGFAGVESAIVELSKAPRERKVREPRAPKAASSPAAASSEEEGPRGESNTRVVFRNIPREFEVEKLRELAGRAGTVSGARIDRRNRMGRVSYESEEAAAKALQTLNGTTFEGVEVKTERELLPRKRAPRKAAAPAPAPAAEGGRRKKAPRAAEPAVEAAPGRRVRVAGLTEAATPDHLKAHFAPYGRIDGARIVGGRNIGFVTFDDAEAATKALAADGTSLNGGTLAVTLDEGRAPGERGAGRRRQADDEDAAPAAKPERTLYLGGLQADVHSEEVLRAAAGRFGAIESVEIARRGTFAYVKYASEGAVAAAVAALSGGEINGVAVKAEEATNPAPRADRPRQSRRGRGEEA